MKKYIISSFVLISTFLFMGSVAADGVGNVTCKSLFGRVDNPQDTAYWLQWILSAMRYIGIIALLVLSTIDFINALVNDDKDALKKAGSKSLKRFIYCVILFFIPIIVELLMNFVGAYGTCDIG